MSLLDNVRGGLRIIFPPAEGEKRIEREGSMMRGYRIKKDGYENNLSDARDNIA